MDTNVLLDYSIRNDSRGVKLKLISLVKDGFELFIANQSLFEYWSVATRPAESNGMNLAPADAAELISGLRKDFPVLIETDDLLDHWLSICQRYEVRGRPSHDARLIALADAHQITHFFTLDAGFYRRFTHMTIVTP